MRKSLLLLLAALLLAGCAQSPSPNNTGKVAQAAGRTSSEAHTTSSVVLYAPDLEGMELIRSEKEMVVPDGQLPLQAALVALLQEDEEAIAPLFGGGATLRSLVKTRDVLLVDLAIRQDPAELGERVLMQSCVALVRTAMANSTVEYVQIWLNGQALASRGVLNSPMTLPDLTLERLWILHQYYMSRGETWPQSDTGAQRKVLFFKDTSGLFVLGSVCEDTERDGNQLADLVSRLRQAPGEDGLSSAIPQHLTLALAELAYDEESDEQLVNFWFTGPQYEMPSTSALQAMGLALSLSVYCNFSGVDGVRVYLDNKSITTLPDTAISGMAQLRAEDFLPQVADMLTLYFPVLGAGTLRQVRRAVSQSEYAQLRSSIDQLLRGPLATEDTALTNAFPLGVTSEDLLSAQAQGDRVIVSFSQDFADYYPMDEQRERLMLYAMVNTLTHDGRVGQVQIQVESSRVGALGRMDLTNPLLRNPGLNE